MTAVSASPAVPALLASLAGVGAPSGSVKLHHASQDASVPGSADTCRPTISYTYQMIKWLPAACSAVQPPKDQQADTLAFWGVVCDTETWHDCMRACKVTACA